MKAVVLMGAFPADTSHLTPLAEMTDLTVYGTSSNPGYPYDPVPPEECKHRDFRRMGPARRGHIVWLYPGLSKALDQDQPDVLHVISEPWGFLAMQAARWAKKHPRTSLVIHACDTIWWHGSKAEQAARRTLVHRMIPRIDAYVAENEMAISQARSAGLDDRAVTETIHTNPRDPRIFHPAADAEERAALRRQLSLPEEGVGIGFLGRLVPEKGPLLLLDAFEGLGPKREGAWISIAGRGPLAGDVERRCKEVGGVFVEGLGYPDDVSAYMRALDILVVPSWKTASWEEQSPRVVIEAMMSGCVAVVARSGALPEMVLDAGITFEERSQSDLTRALAEALEPSVRADLSKRARASAIDRYSGPSIALRLFDAWGRARTVRRRIASRPVMRRAGRSRTQARARAGRPIRLLMVGHDLHGRGTERSVVRLLQNFDRSKLDVTLALVHATGEFMGDVPDYVPTIEISPDATRTSSALWDVVRLIRREKPDCVLGIHTSPGRLVAISKLFRPRTPVVCWEPDPLRRTEGDKGNYFVRRLATAATHRLATAVLCPSEVVAEEAIKELWLPRRKVTVLPHPSVDEAVFDAARQEVAESPFGEGRPVIVTIGNMHAHKAQNVLIDAFARVRRERDCSLVIIGKGPLEDALRMQANRLGVGEDVHFLGFRPNPFGFVAASDVYVSSAASEGFDISQVEAMACGVPVVVTDAPRYKVVEHERTGLLVQPGDPRALAAAIERVLDDPNLARDMSEAAKVEARRLSADVVTREYEDFVLGVVGATPRTDGKLRIGHYYADLMHPGGLPDDAHALIEAQLALGDDVIGFGLGPPREGVGAPEGMAYVYEDRSPRGAWRLSRRIAWGPERPDVLTVWSALNPGNEIILRAASRAGIPTILTPHGVLTPKLYETGRAVPKRIYRRAGTAPSLRRWVDVLHAVSPQEEQEARALGFRGPAHIFSFGTPPVPAVEGPGPLRRALELDADAVLVGFFGRMDLYQKGLDVLISAFALCRDLAESRKATFVLAGRGSDGQWLKIQALLNTHALDGIVRTAGPFDRDERFGALADLDTLVHVSRFDGITRVMRESAPLGVPSIVTPEANAQLLVDAGAARRVDLDPAAIAHELRAVVEDPQWRMSASIAARAWARENTWTTCAEHFRDAYDRALTPAHERGAG